MKDYIKKNKFVKFYFLFVYLLFSMVGSVDGRFADLKKQIIVFVFGIIEVDFLPSKTLVF